MKRRGTRCMPELHWGQTGEPCRASGERAIAPPDAAGRVAYFDERRDMTMVTPVRIEGSGVQDSGSWRAPWIVQSLAGVKWLVCAVANATPLTIRT